MYTSLQAKRILIIALLITASLAPDTQAKEIEKKLSIADGEKFVKLALQDTAYKDSGFIDPPDNTKETFLIYPILGATEGKLTDFGINPWTGDVWDTFECKIISNPQLQAQQAKIKQRFNSRELKEYARLHKLKPDRGYDLEPCP